MFESNIGDIDHDLAVLSMDKILYDNGFPTGENEIHSESEVEAFYDAINMLNGYIYGDDCRHPDDTAVIFHNHCLKEYVRLALEYGSMNGISRADNLWIKKLKDYIEYEMSDLGDYDYAFDYNVRYAETTFLRVYVGPEFYQTVCLVRSVASILNFAEDSCRELKKLTAKKTEEIIPMKKQKERKNAA